MESVPKEIQEKAHRICGEYIGGIWAKVKASDIILEQITKGMCNLTFRCALPENFNPEEDEPTQVLFKLVLNKMERSTFAIMTENLIFALLAQKKLAPQLHAVFEDGRIEEFIPSRTLNPDELREPNIKECLAKKLAHFHAFKAPVSKNPRSQTSWYAMFREALQDIQVNKKFREGNDPETQSKLDKLLEIPLQKEIEWLRSYVHTSTSPVVFSHTDLQVNNILLKTYPTEDILQLVDFEFSGYNYRGYDFASVFLGHCFQYDVPDPPYFYTDWSKFPSLEEQKNFIRIYAKEFKKITKKILDIEKVVDEIIEETKIFFMVQHYTFGLAGIYRYEQTEFKIDWLSYAKERFKMYYEHKKLFFGEGVAK